MEEERIEAEGVSIKSLLAAGAHFGHQTSRWNPRMKRHIFAARNGIHIIDLEQTADMLNKASEFVRDLVAKGENVIFVGTKRQAKDVVEEEAKRCGMPYVNQRWLGGMLTNFATIQSRIDYLVRLEDRRSRGELERLPKREALLLEKEISHLNRLLGGVKEMTDIPGALFIIDPVKERIAVAEGIKVGVPLVAIVDTDCNPDEIDHPIPANDDAIKSVKLLCSVIADAVLEGKQAREEAAEPAEGLLLVAPEGEEE